MIEKYGKRIAKTQSDTLFYSQLLESPDEKCIFALKSPDEKCCIYTKSPD